MIFAGDFKQLKPVGEPALFMPGDKRTHDDEPDQDPDDADAEGTAQRPKAKRARTNASASHGRVLWLRLNHAVILDVLMRQQNPRDQALLNRVRENQATEADYAFLQSRILANLPPEEQTRFKDAPLVTSRNIVRTQVATRTLIRRARETNRKLLWVVAQDNMPQEMPELAKAVRTRLANMTDDKTQKMPSILPLVIGEKYLFGANKFPEAGHVNNGAATLVKIVPDAREPLVDWTTATPYTFKYMPRQLVMEMEKPPVPFQLPGFGPNQLPVAPTKAKFTTTWSELTAGSYKTKEASRLSELTFERTQFCMAPADATTTHRAQGRTCNLLVGDLTKPDGNMDPAHVYTVLTRTTSLDGLAILRPFQPEVLLQPPNRHLNDELTRLHRIQQGTLAAYRDNDPVDDVPLRECWPPHPVQDSPAAPPHAPRQPGSRKRTAPEQPPSLHTRHLQTIEDLETAAAAAKRMRMPVSGRVPPPPPPTATASPVPPARSAPAAPAPSQAPSPSASSSAAGPRRSSRLQNRQ